MKKKPFATKFFALRTMLFRAESITDNAKDKALLQALA